MVFDPTLQFMETFAAYEAEVLTAVERGVGARPALSLDPDDCPDDLPVHRIHIVRERSDAFSMFTCGFGRVPQPRALEGARCRYAELYARVLCPMPEVAVTLSYLGRLMHRPGPSDLPWAELDTVVLPEPLYGRSHFVLGPAVFLPLADQQRTIAFLPVLPISDAEYAEAYGDWARFWFDARLDEAAHEQSMLRRWTTGQP